jgi:hypothetical protein
MFRLLLTSVSICCFGPPALPTRAQSGKFQRDKNRSEHSEHMKVPAMKTLNETIESKQ